MEGPEGPGDMMGSLRWADGWLLAVLVGTLGGARPWEDALGVEWSLAQGTRQGSTEEGGVASLAVLLVVSWLFPPWWVWRMGVWGTSAHPTLK